MERADAAELFDDPQHPYTVGLLGSIPRLSEERDRLLSIEGSVPPALAAARIGVYQLLFTPSVPAYAVVSASVDLARALNQAPDRGWRVIDMAADWARVYPFEAPPAKP